MIDFSIMQTKNRTATVADLRNNFRRVSSWLAYGETVMITRRGHICAHLTPPPAPTKPFKMPDFRAQAKRICGDRPPLTEKQVHEMKEFELERQEG